ncbi:hypothetical protein [Blastococcus tunisiensis]|uniref:hypothetical protein n=1 Tax=Blastococcus tunisiensis TaxID=1798228 RepID=UPI001113AE6B|nr:hypothetical protein [Blastococcus sp. DSM 46838]
MFLLVALASPAGATTTPGVSATPYNSGDHPWSTDGCTVVPDSGIHGTSLYYGQPPWGANMWTTAFYDFNHACIHHDGCYAGRWASKGTCDSWFLNDMRASCDAMYPSDSQAAARIVCRDRAWQYYVGVTTLGWPAYYASSSAIPIA